MIAENARSVAYKELPAIPPEYANDDAHASIVLFYQYIEPVWSPKEHKRALKKVLGLANEFRITGRGRVAQEGLNCTLSGSPKNIRAFCMGLREWNSIFKETDFKITDGVSRSQIFKSLSVKKADELVAYGLSGEKAPSLSKFAGIHLEADEYHKAMAEKDTVIIDVRNAYESNIGCFQPPKGGAELIDPKMRNSIEFPKWLNDPQTQEKLNGKKVLMYCTGGIRCERASALLNQMATVNPNLNPKGVYELRGGIERYVKTFPDGGHWKGKNYLFDRRMEQIPGQIDDADADASINSKCCLCRKKWSVYRGQFKCSRSLCGVPVIVCNVCKDIAATQPHILTCELCKEGYLAPGDKPDLIALKRRAESLVNANSKDANGRSEAGENDTSKRKSDGSGESLGKKGKFQDGEYVTFTDRLFVSRIPLTVTKTKLLNALTPVVRSKFSGVEKKVDGVSMKAIEWLVNKDNGAFFGSCIVLMNSSEVANQIIEYARKVDGGIKIDKKKLRVEFASAKKCQQDIPFPSSTAAQGEYPPVGR